MKIPPDFGIQEADLTQVVVPNDPRRARKPAEEIVAAVRRERYDDDATFAIKLSLEEALTNAIKHGNRGDPDKTVTLRYCVRPERTVIMVRDEGSGFEPEAVPDPTADENLERPNGRGLMLMQSYMTRVEFNERGNEVWMLKENQAAAGGGSAGGGSAGGAG